MALLGVHLLCYADKGMGSLRQHMMSDAACFPSDIQKMISFVGGKYSNPCGADSMLSR
jgi:hypothetical protein